MLCYGRAWNAAESLLTGVDQPISPKLGPDEHAQLKCDSNERDRHEYTFTKARSTRCVVRIRDASCDMIRASCV